MRTKLQLIDKYRRAKWLGVGNRYFFVLRVVDGNGINAKIYERQVSRQCYYRFAMNEFVFSTKPGGSKQLAHHEEEPQASHKAG